jgi:uracil-DNA glycosylase
MPLYHPAAVLHKNSEAMRKIMFDDMKRLKALLKKVS